MDLGLDWGKNMLTKERGGSCFTFTCRQRNDSESRLVAGFNRSPEITNQEDDNNNNNNTNSSNINSNKKCYCSYYSYSCSYSYYTNSLTTPTAPTTAAAHTATTTHYWYKFYNVQC